MNILHKLFTIAFIFQVTNIICINPRLKQIGYVLALRHKALFACNANRFYPKTNLGFKKTAAAKYQFISNNKYSEFKAKINHSNPDYINLPEIQAIKLIQNNEYIDNFINYLNDNPTALIEILKHKNFFKLLDNPSIKEFLKKNPEIGKNIIMTLKKLDNNSEVYKVIINILTEPQFKDANPKDLLIIVPTVIITMWTVVIGGCNLYAWLHQPD